MIDLNTIYNTDCLELFKQIPDESIDLIVTDPPYRCTSRGSSGTMGGYWKEDAAKKGRIFQHNDISCRDYLPEFFRMLAADSHFYVMCNDVNLTEMLTTAQACGFHFVTLITWDKVKPICGTYYMKQTEHILLFRKGKHKPINNCGTTNILRVPVKKQKDADGANLHDTEKPVELMQILIENSTQAGEIVMDPFVGIGAVPIACLRTGRKFIGVDIDPRYCEITESRIGEWIDKQLEEL